MIERGFRVPRFVCLSAWSLLLCFPIVTRGQEELRAYQQSGYESRFGTLALSKGPAGFML